MRLGGSSGSVRNGESRYRDSVCLYGNWKEETILRYTLVISLDGSFCESLYAAHLALALASGAQLVSRIPTCISKIARTLKHALLQLSDSWAPNIQLSPLYITKKRGLCNIIQLVRTKSAGVFWNMRLKTLFNVIQ